jgi:hypothetical protein
MCAALHRYATMLLLLLLLCATPVAVTVAARHSDKALMHPPALCCCCSALEDSQQSAHAQAAPDVAKHLCSAQEHVLYPLQVCHSIQHVLHAEPAELQGRNEA